MFRTVVFMYDIGDEVKVEPIKMVGRVDSLCYDALGIQYRVVYWNDGQRCSQWLYDWEIAK